MGCLDENILRRLRQRGRPGGKARRTSAQSRRSPTLPLTAINLLHAVAYGYRATGQDDKAREQLDYIEQVLAAKENEGSAGSPGFLEQKALSLAMQGKLSQGGEVLTAAVEAGWRNYRIVMHDPRWQELLELPAVGPSLAIVTADLDRQVIEVEAILSEQNY